RARRSSFVDHRDTHQLELRLGNCQAGNAEKSNRWVAPPEVLAPDGSELHRVAAVFVYICNENLKPHEVVGLAAGALDRADDALGRAVELLDERFAFADLPGEIDRVTCDDRVREAAWLRER